MAGGGYRPQLSFNVGRPKERGDDQMDPVPLIRSGDVDAIRQAVARDPDFPRHKNESGVSIICMAVYLRKEEIAHVLASYRRDLDIFEASSIGDLARVRKLSEWDPEAANAYSPDGFHSIGYSCFFGREEIFDHLLAHGADVNAPSRNAMQVRPLHSAVAQADPEAALRFAQRLLECGASPNVAQQGDFTPLHEASLRGHLPLVRLLLRYGAAPEARSANGERPIELAEKAGHKEVIAILRAAAQQGAAVDVR
jgi:uncharacterized protein